MAAARMGVKRIRGIARSEAKRVVASQAEDHVLDTFLAAPPAPINSTIAITPVSAPAQGTDFFNRTGANIRGKSLFFRWQIRRSLLAAALTGNITRMMLVLDTQSDALLPSGAGSASSILTSTSTVAQFNPLTRQRFLVLWAKQVVVSPEHPVASGKKFIRLKNPSIHFLTPAAGTIAAPASLGTNNIFLVVWGDLLPGVDNPQFDYNVRFRFEDM